MLGKPEHGWALFQLNTLCHAYDLSYLTDVAIEWLDQAIHGLNTLNVFSVHGFCEPGRMICTVSYWNCYLIFEDEDRDGVGEYQEQAQISMLEFCEKLHSDIQGNLDAWVHWNDTFYEKGEEKFEESLMARRKDIQKRLDTLKCLLETKAAYFEPNCCFL